MDLLEVSRLQLISEVHESKKMIHRLIELPKDIQPFILNSLLPYFSMLVNEVDKLFINEGDTVFSSKFEDINGESFTNLNKKIRASSKLLTDKKNLRVSIKDLSIEMEKFHNELIQDYNDQQLEYIKKYGQPDLGVFYYKNKPYANSSQISLYLKPFNSSIMEINQDITKFSKQISLYIRDFCQIIEEQKKTYLNQDNSFTHIKYIDFSSQDYIYTEEQKRNIFNVFIDKRVSLYLLNMQCQINFALYILDLIIGKHPFKYRIQLLIYYYSVQAIKFAYKSGYLEPLEQYKERINSVIESHKKIFNSDAFRNNLFHYKLSQEISSSLNQNYFENMVETFTSETLESLLKTVYMEMSIVEKLIKEIIS